MTVPRTVAEVLREYVTLEVPYNAKLCLNGHEYVKHQLAKERITVAVQGQRASALRYADPCVLALFSALLVFRLLPRGFANHELREHLAPLLGQDPSALTQGRMTYQLRRLRLHRLIVRRPGSHRYEVTSRGLRVALFFTRSYARVLRPGLAELSEMPGRPDSQLRRAADQFEAAMDQYMARAKLTQQNLTQAR